MKRIVENKSCLKWMNSCYNKINKQVEMSINCKWRDTCLYNLQDACQLQPTSSLIGKFRVLCSDFSRFTFQLKRIRSVRFDSIVIVVVVSLISSLFSNKFNNNSNNNLNNNYFIKLAKLRCGWCLLFIQSLLL